jgi:hypothetical protein
MPPQVTPEMRELMDETRAMLAGGKMEPDLIPWGWESETDPEFAGLRRPNEQTPDYLGRVLAWAGMPELAARARLGHFDDFHAPAEVADGMEIVRLVGELRAEARKVVDSGGNRYSPDARRMRAERAAQIENAARRGEFDATKAESDRWAASKGAQETFDELLRGAEKTSRRVEKVGRNDPCPCGSGEKYKRCCGRGS